MLRSWLQLLELVDRFGPILLEQARQRAVGEQAAVRLAARTVVRLVVGIADSLHLGLANGAWLAVLAVHGHLVVKRRDLAREVAMRLLAQSVEPCREHLARNREQARRLLGGQTASQCHARQAPSIDNLVRLR